MTGVSNLNDLNRNLDALNKESWGSWDVELVSPDSVDKWILENQVKIKEFVHNTEFVHSTDLCHSLVDLAVRIKQEPYISSKAADNLFLTIEDIRPSNFPFRALSDDAITCIMSFLSDNDLHLLGLVNLKIFFIARRVGLVRVEIGLEILFNKVSHTIYLLEKVKNAQDLFEMVKENPDLILALKDDQCLSNKIEEATHLVEGLKEAQALFEGRNEFFIGSQERRDALRKAFIPLFKGFQINYILEDNPELYADKPLLELMFKKQPVFPYLSVENENKKWKKSVGGMWNLSLKENKIFTQSNKYLFAFLNALTRGDVKPEHLQLLINGDIKSELKLAFVEAIRNNTSITTIKFYLNNAAEGLDLFKEMLKSINDNHFIDTVEFSGWNESLELLMKKLNWAFEDNGVGGMCCHFNKLGTYVNHISDGPLKGKCNIDLSSWEKNQFADYQFESCFSDDQKLTFQELVRLAKNAPYTERKNILNNAIRILFVDLVPEEMYKAALLQLLCKYDEHLFSEIADQLPADYFESYFKF